MAQDYDAPRTRVEDEPEDAHGLTTTRNATSTAVIDLEDVDTAEGIDLPGADLSGEELVYQVIPVQADEFTCHSCFLVRHRSQLAPRSKEGATFCLDCEG